MNSATIKRDYDLRCCVLFVLKSCLILCICRIWVVAPIKRAVDDGTAKELMGEQFKRRLLMDGQYGNIAFICTQTDDCEATEIMRDHEDIAARVPGRWEKMTSLRDKLNGIEAQLSDLQQEEEDLKDAVVEAKELLVDTKSKLEDALNPGTENDDDDDDDEAFGVDDDSIEVETSPTKKLDENLIKELTELATQQQKLKAEAKQAHLSWRRSNNSSLTTLSSDCNKLQRRLKAICAKVRNEYSTKCLQEDFISGLKEIYRDAEGSSEGEGNDVGIPPDMNLPVFCISANDYLKVTG